IYGYSLCKAVAEFRGDNHAEKNSRDNFNRSLLRRIWLWAKYKFLHHDTAFSFDADAHGCPEAFAVTQEHKENLERSRRFNAAAKVNSNTNRSIYGRACCLRQNYPRY